MLNKNIIVSFFGFCLYFTSHFSIASTEEEELEIGLGDEQFISIATGRKKLVSKAPSVTSVITAEQIFKSGARTIDEVLESIPGLHVSASSTNLSPIYSIRGISTDRNPHVLVLLNGVATTNSYFGDRGPVSSMPVNAVSRVEIIRGPGSAVYGADAFAGVINIITKSAQEYDGLSVGARAAEFGTADLWLSYGNTDEIDIAFSIQGHTTDGDDDRIVASDGQTFWDTVTGTTASNAPASMSTNQNRVDLNFEAAGDDWSLKYWSRHIREVGAGPGIALALDPNGRGRGDYYLLDLTLKDLLKAENWDTSLQLTYYDTTSVSESYTLYPAGTVLPIDTVGNINPVVGTPTQFVDGLIGNPTISEARTAVEFVSQSQNIDSHIIRFSVGLSHVGLVPEEIKNFGPGVNVGTLTDVTGTDNVFITTETRDNVYLTIQDEIEIAADWELTSGVRVDHYSDFGDTINPRFALVWDTSNALTTKFLYGRAFRAPSFAELYAINNPVVLGNPDLEPEIINTVEIAFDYKRSPSRRYGLSIFMYDITDLIQFTPDGTGASTAQNTGDQTGEGIEFEALWKSKIDVTYSGNIVLLNATDETLNVEVANTPKIQLYFQVDWEIADGVHLIPQLHHIGKQTRVDGDPRGAIDSYSLMNLALTSSNDSISWQIGVNNLTDENYVDPSPFENLPTGTGSFVPGDFPEAGRQFYVTGQIKF